MWQAINGSRCTCTMCVFGVIRRLIFLLDKQNVMPAINNNKSAVDVNGLEKSPDREYMYQSNHKLCTLNEKKLLNPEVNRVIVHENKDMADHTLKIHVGGNCMEPYKNPRSNGVIDDTTLGQNIVLRQSKSFNETIVASNCSPLATGKGRWFPDGTVTESPMTNNTVEFRATSTPLRADYKEIPSFNSVETSRVHSGQVKSESPMKCPIAEGTVSDNFAILDLSNQEMISALVKINGIVQICAVPAKFAQEATEIQIGNAVDKEAEKILRVIDVDDAGNIITEPVGSVPGNVMDTTEKKSPFNPITANTEVVKTDERVIETLCEVPNTNIGYIYRQHSDHPTKVRLVSHDKDVASYVPENDVIKGGSKDTLEKYRYGPYTEVKEQATKYSKKRIKECYAIVRSQELEQKRNAMFHMDYTDVIARRTKAKAMDHVRAHTTTMSRGQPTPRNLYERNKMGGKPHRIGKKKILSLKVRPDPAYKPTVNIRRVGKLFCTTYNILACPIDSRQVLGNQWVPYSGISNL